MKSLTQFALIAATAIVALAAAQATAQLVTAQEPAPQATKPQNAVPEKAAASTTATDTTTATTTTTTRGQRPQLEPDFIWLFDGKSLQGWEGKKEWFRIEQEAVVAGSLKEKIPNNEFLCTQQSYGNFELRLQVQLKGQGNNAGVQFRSQRVPDHHEVSGYQCDAGGAFNRSVWGALYDESRRKKMLAEGPADDVKAWTREGKWNDLWIRCEGSRIQLWLNGHQTVDYTEADEKIPRVGIIGLQIHSGPPTEAWYRAIRIRTL